MEKAAHEAKSSVVYIITNDPKERIDLVSSVLAQALTALSFGYASKLFLMDRGANLCVRGYLDGLRSEAFEPLSVLMDSYREMGGKVYVCSPSTTACGIRREEFEQFDDYVNASALFESAKTAVAVFTY